MRKVLVVGRNSFLARSVVAALPRDRLRLAGHREVDDPGLLDGVGCVLNFARHPALASPDHAPGGANDPDLRLAARLRDRPGVAYVMMSSRKVYAPGDGRPLHEDAALGPTDAYGRNKLLIEERLRAALGERLTVLRIANVFGDERLPGRRTFMAAVLDRLKREARIVFDMSPLTPRDFLPAAAFGRVAARIALDPPGGVVNVGSGIALAVGRLAHWVLLGYGRGRLVATSGAERDAFVLDVGRLRAAYGPPCTGDELRDASVGLGRGLAAGGGADAGDDPA